MTVIMWILISALVAAGLLGIIRVCTGPSHLDRVLAIDYLSIVGIALVVLLMVFTDEPMVLDVGICLALVGFLAAYAFAKFAPEENE